MHNTHPAERQKKKKIKCPEVHGVCDNTQQVELLFTADGNG